MKSDPPKKKIPGFVKPMLATLIDEPFDSAEWLFEVKWDGFRALAFINQGKVHLKSRNGLSFNHKFPEIVEELNKTKGSVVLDGEIVALDSKGKSHFQLIQNYKQRGGTLCYYVFDLLYIDGKDLRDLPLIERKKLLKKFLNKYKFRAIRYSDHILGKGKKFFKAAMKKQLEGIIGKKAESVYQSRRSRDWVKVKTGARQEVVICGFTEPKGSRKNFGALIAGVYDKQGLQYAGHVGGGFDETLLREIKKKLNPLVRKTCPFKTVPKVNSPVTWVKPQLIAEVSFTEWTNDNIMRHPIFQGLRSDKSPKSVKREIPKHGKK